MVSGTHTIPISVGILMGVGLGNSMGKRSHYWLLSETSRSFEAHLRFQQKPLADMNHEILIGL